MRILFIVPAFQDVYGSYRRLYKSGFLNPPMSLCYIAAAAEKDGHTAKIIDGEAENLSIEQILDQAEKFSPDICGLTATSIDFHKAKQLMKHLKRRFPDLPIIIGGTHINIFGAEVLEDTTEIDFGCIGDGEDLIRELLGKLSSNSSVPVYDIPGLVYRSNGEVVTSTQCKQESDLDQYPFPSRNLLKNELYYRAVPFRGYKPTAAFMSSRGCPFKCKYCAVDNICGGSKVRLRSAANVLDELELLVKKIGVSHIAFNDDCLTLNKERMYEICEGIHARNLQFTWEGLSRADLVSKDLLKVMKRAGFVRISYGIESGNPKILKAINKGETIGQIKQAFKISKEVGIVTRGSVILGFPYETQETVKDTLRFIMDLKELDQVVINVLQPYPGTEVRQMILRGEGGSAFTADKNQYDNLKRFGSSSIQVNDLTPQKLVFYQKFGFLRFYLRPRSLWRNLRIAGLRVFMQDGFNFVRSVIGF